ncbi:helix-turn-helix transcriptional regulator [Chelatococcus sp. HY11]|uniref:helix-turn-helix domain-containing protein n=2 Tax=unclassified Chelatococcus TaxID=2638111 RepID=UPI001BD0688A|nr:helix-turn-helix transcriptional regulator [Chelatococcus sp. HY11]MBS7743719.1 helix-turn-helix transcriptional regulator [Chelatococcus sp. HY11]CAH1664621.1 XRE family transcriptional regulator [Hyphomicrobiales bacterium]CAH1688380.1 XRE family transcriptional regulator [Hyphomicrobiales bacterium]
MVAVAKFGLILREIRRQKGLTQEELAHKAGRSVDAVSQWERAINWPTLKTLVQISEALEVPVRTFFDVPDAQKSDQRLQMDVEARLLLDSLPDNDLAVALEQLRALTKRR